jgi:hypothetical protein
MIFATNYILCTLFQPDEHLLRYPYLNPPYTLLSPLLANLKTHRFKILKFALHKNAISKRSKTKHDFSSFHD